MNVPNLREWDPKESDAKNVQQTKMLDVEAREQSENNVSKPGMNFKEYTSSHPSFGKLGAMGRE